MNTCTCNATTSFDELCQSCQDDYKNWIDEQNELIEEMTYDELFDKFMVETDKLIAEETAIALEME